jgi:hypothetical protein
MSRVFLPMVLAFVAGCARCSDVRPLVDGTYYSPSGEERIVVRGPKLEFHVLILDPEKRSVGKRIFDNYSVWPDGRIQPYPMRSVELLKGIGSCEWKWSGSEIVREGCRHESPKTAFVRRR